MKLIEIMLDDKVFISYRCQDEEVQTITDMFKNAKITDIAGDSVKDKTRMDIFDIANPKPHPVAEPKIKRLKLVPFLNWN